MQIDLSKNECVLLTHLLKEEIETINSLANEVDTNDSKELKEQIVLMKSIIEKLK